MWWDKREQADTLAALLDGHICRIKMYMCKAVNAKGLYAQHDKLDVTCAGQNYRLQELQGLLHRISSRFSCAVLGCRGWGEVWLSHARS